MYCGFIRVIDILFKKKRLIQRKPSGQRRAGVRAAIVRADAGVSLPRTIDNWQKKTCTCRKKPSFYFLQMQKINVNYFWHRASFLPISFVKRAFFHVKRKLRNAVFEPVFFRHNANFFEKNMCIQKKPSFYFLQMQKKR